MMSSPATSRRPRIIVDLAAVGFPEIPRLGIHKILSATDPIEEHRHPGAMEICYLVSGEQSWQRKGITYHLRGNHVFWTAPGEPHRGGAPFHGKGLIYWFQLRLPGRGKGFLALSPKESRPVIQALRTLPQRHFIGDKRLKTIFEEIHSIVTGPAFPLRKLQIHNRLLEWLTLVIECARSNPAAGPDRSILRVLEEIDSRIGTLQSVKELAGVARLSVSHFHAKFRRQTGISPAEYLMRQKVERAKEILASGDHSVTETAHRLGFSSSQYFATVFRKFVRRPPRSFLPKT